MESSRVRRMELKVCERCGGLWLRPEASDWRYCGGCLEKLREFPQPDGKRRAEVSR